MVVSGGHVDIWNARAAHAGGCPVHVCVFFFFFFFLGGGEGGGGGGGAIFFRIFLFLFGIFFCFCGS